MKSITRREFTQRRDQQAKGNNVWLFHLNIAWIAIFFRGNVRNMFHNRVTHPELICKCQNLSWIRTQRGWAGVRSICDAFSSVLNRCSDSGCGSRPTRPCQRRYVACFPECFAAGEFESTPSTLAVLVAWAFRGSPRRAAMFYGTSISSSISATRLRFPRTELRLSVKSAPRSIDSTSVPQGLELRISV